MPEYDGHPGWVQIFMRQIDVVEMAMKNDPNLLAAANPLVERLINITNGPQTQITIQQNEGSTMSETYNNQGIAGAMGRDNKVSENTFTQGSPQSFSSVDLSELAGELSAVRKHLRANGAGEWEEDIAVAELAQAERAAIEGDSEKTKTHLAKAGRWALDAATALGVGLAVVAIKTAMGLE